MTTLGDALQTWLPHQRWFAGSSIESIDLGTPTVLGDDLLQLFPTVEADGHEAATYHVLLGLREPADAPSFLEGKDHADLGLVDVDGTERHVYDALVDPALVHRVLSLIAPGVETRHVRALAVEQSNTSMVFDEAVIAKVFRRLHPGPNPDIELPEALHDAGFEAVVPTLGVWRQDGYDLGVARTFLKGSTDGWRLALASVRDHLAGEGEPAAAGGDFAPEARRLGQITADMHLALADRFGRAAAGLDWRSDVEERLDHLPGEIVDRWRVGRAMAAAADLADLGPAIRDHGDFHLGQVLRDDHGWTVIDFEGEPARPLSERQQPSSPLRDVAGMLQSFHYAAHVALREQWDPDDEAAAARARDWVHRNQAAFLDGYLGQAGGHDLLPADDADRAQMIGLFRLAKALYEVDYELAHRPDWVAIPLAAIDDLVGALA